MPQPAATPVSSPASQPLPALRARWSRIGLLTIRRKIAVAFLVICLITAAFAAFAVRGIDRTSALVVLTFDRSLMSIDYARAAAADFAAMEAVLARRRLLAAADTAQDGRPGGGIGLLDARQQELEATITDDLRIAGQRALSPRVAEASAKVASLVTAWLHARAALLAGRPPADAWAALDTLQAAVDAQVDLLVNLAAGDGFHHREAALAETATIRQLTVALLAAALILSASVALLLARQIMGPVGAASAAAGAIARGELATPIPPAGRDELGQLLGAMAVMRDSIAVMMDREVTRRRSAQGQLAAAMEGSQEGILLFDAGGRLALANSRLHELFPDLAALLVPGTTLAALAAASLRLGLFAGTGAPGRRSLRARLLAPGLLAPGHAGDVPALEERLADGRWLRISRSPTADGGIVALCSDITPLKQRERDLQMANFHLDAALNNMAQGLCLYGPNKRLRLANRRFAEIFNLPPRVLREGTALRDVLGASLEAGSHEGMSLAELEAQQRNMAEQRQADHRLGVPSTVPLSGGRVVDIAYVSLPDGGWVATYEDVTARRQTEETIAFLARHDALTGLPNRVLFTDRMHQALAGLSRGARFAVMCVDLDHFKSVNDTLGHGVGDLLLQTTAHRLANCIRETDTLARLGGDEFAIIQMGVDNAEQAGELAQRLIEAVGEVFVLDGHQVQISASIGVAHAPADGATLELLMKNADTALYRGKLEGRAGYRFFEPEMDARLQARRALEIDLRRALAAREFRLFYQPLVAMVPQRVIGFEALLRWVHPQRGMVPPSAFIGLAEEIGMIGPIGEWVLRTACAEAAGWPDPLKVAVNVSPAQFKDPRLVQVVKEALRQSGLPPHRLELEITESVLLHDNAATLAVLHQMRALGARISMDDFGTGYSSLSYLRSFPFDKIKIDQSFVRDVSSSSESAAIVRAVAGLGGSLGMRTTAEGVETSEQLDWLRAEGCTEVQGYLFSRPLPAADVPGVILAINEAAAAGRPPPGTRPSGEDSEAAEDEAPAAVD